MLKNFINANILTEDGIKKYRNKIKGFKGEQNVASQIKSLNIDYSICLHNACFRNSNVSTKEIDFILITPFCIFIIESKYRSCSTVKFSRYDYFETYLENETKKENPIFQLQTQKNYLSHFVESLGINIPICEFLIFSGNENKKPELNLSSPLPIDCELICHYSDLGSRLTERLDMYKKINPTPISSEQIEFLSNNIKNSCYFPKDLFLPKKEDWINKTNFKISSCKHHDIMIPMYSPKTGKFIIVCPESTQDEFGNWSCPFHEINYK